MATLVIGLGNPGGAYSHTRHNMGYACLDELERLGRFSKPRREHDAHVVQGQIEGFDMVMARPTTFMNDSGRAGVRLARAFGQQPHDVIVAHDDIDLPLGRLRLRRGGSDGGQRGVRSLIESWRTPDFVRVRMGVGRPPDDDAIDHVLGRFLPEEREPAHRLAKRAAEAIVVTVCEGLEIAMSRFNRADAV